MSNLSNLHISSSYKGLINLADSTQQLPSQSGDINLQDGEGNNIGVKINAQTNDVTIVNNFRVDGNTDLNGNLDVSGSFIHSGSIDIKGNVTVDGDISAQIATFDTVNTRLLHVTEESASVIFSSGSNVIGDDITDTQEIVGITTISGSLGVTGNQSNTGSLTVSGEISSSTLNGIGNVSNYSSSVDSRISSLSNRTGSVDSSVTALNAFTSSQLSINSGYNSFTQSADNRLTSLETFTGSAVTLTEFNSYTSSTDNRLDSIESFTASLQTDFVSTGSFNSFTQSTDNHLAQLDLYTASTDNRLTQIEIKTGSLQNQVDSLISVTGSYATTGSNTFIGDNVFSGSVHGEVYDISIASSTASIDCSQGNFFTLTLPSGSTNLNATNIQAGQTITLRLTQPSAGYGSIFLEPTIKEPTDGLITLTPSVNAEDVITFVSFDTSAIYAVGTLNFI